MASEKSHTEVKPNRETRHLNDIQEFRQYPDQLWHSKQQSSPSLLLYRKLSSDSGKGIILDGECVCLEYSSKLQTTKEKCHLDLPTGKKNGGITNTVTPVPWKGSEGSPCQLDTPGEDVDTCRGRTGRTSCSCTSSNVYTSPNNCCHSARSSPDRSSSPALCSRLNPSASQPHQRHVRRGSLPVSMLAFHKVITEGGSNFCCYRNPVDFFFYMLRHSK